MSTNIKDVFTESKIEYCNLKHRLYVGNYESIDNEHDLLQTIATHPSNPLFPFKAKMGARGASNTELETEK